jgi:hypothetical protein
VAPVDYDIAVDPDAAYVAFTGSETMQARQPAINAITAIQYRAGLRAIDAAAAAKWVAQD